MLRRPVRVLVLLLTVAVTAGVVWRVTTNEQARGRTRLASQQMDARAADAIFELSDLRATLHAYVAPGQGEGFWSARAAAQLESIRERLKEVDATATAANHPLAPAFEGLSRLEAAAARAHAHVRSDQMLLAGDIIFTEARDLLDGVAKEISDARQSMARAAAAREGGMANEQSLLAGALLSVWIFALILLVPVPRVPPPMTAPAEPLASPADRVVPPASADVLADAPLAAAPVPAPAADHATPVFQSLAALCLKLGRVSSESDLGPVLAETSALLGARGIVIWLTNEAGDSLVPVAVEGYQDSVVARLGPLPVDTDNVTAAAFRTGEAVTSAAAADHAAAVAVPILSASGTSGVLAAELHAGADLDRVTAVASVLAAQLASLFPAAVPPSEAPPNEDTTPLLTPGA